MGPELFRAGEPQSGPDMRSLDLAVLWMALFVTLALLLIAGTHFTKLELVGPITAYDFCLVLLGTLSLGLRKATLTNRFFFLFALVVALYGGYSVASFGANFNFLRQLAMFLYPVIAALVVSRFIDGGAEGALIAGLRWLAGASVLLQLAIGALVVLQGGSFGDEQYHYLSPASVVLNLFALGWVLAAPQVIVRLVGAPLVLLCLYMSGHSTAVLAGLAQIAVLVLRPFPRSMQVTMILVGLAGAIYAIWWLVDANDATLGGNAMWRFFFWVAVAKQILIDKFGVLGHGFGVPYASPEIEYLLQVVQGYTTTLGVGNESYESTPHNFFLTVAFHVGLLPALILYLAIWRSIVDLCFVPNPADRGGRVLGLGLSMVGASVWAAFNVIVELPHASMLFWLLLFLSLRESGRVRATSKARSRRKTPAHALPA